MKKTLLALFALGSMAMAASDPAYTLTTSAGEGINRSGGCAGISFQLADTARMDVDNELPTDKPLTLQSIKIMGSDTMDSGTTPLCLYIIDSDYKLIAVSDAYTPKNIKSDELTFNFGVESAALVNPDVNKTNLTLSAGEQYYAFFLNASRYSDTNDRNYTASIGSTVPQNDGHPWADSNTVALLLVSFPDTTTAKQNAILNGNSGQYDGFKYNQFGAKMSIALVPEPTTATLSLLALAGLAARRRRH